MKKNIIVAAVIGLLLPAATVFRASAQSGTPDFCQAANQINWSQTLPTDFTVTIASCDAMTQSITFEYRSPQGTLLAPGSTTPYSYVDPVSGLTVQADFVIPSTSTLTSVIERLDETGSLPALSALIQGNDFYDQVIGRGKFNYGAYEDTVLFSDIGGDIIAQVTQDNYVLYEQNLGSTFSLFGYTTNANANDSGIQVTGPGDFNEDGTDDYLVLYRFISAQEGGPGHELRTTGFLVDPLDSTWETQDTLTRLLDPNPSFIENGQTVNFDMSKFTLIGIGDMTNDTYRNEILVTDGDNFRVLAGDPGPNLTAEGFKVLPPLNADSAAILANELSVPGSPIRTLYAGGSDLDLDGFADDFLIGYEQPNMPNGEHAYHFVAYTFDYDITQQTRNDRYIYAGQYPMSGIITFPGSPVSASSFAINQNNEALLSRDLPQGGAQADIGTPSFTVTDDWIGGFTGNVTFTYTGSSQINSWTIKFDTTFEILELWDGVVTSVNNGDGTYTHTVTNGEFNGTLNPNDSATIGFNANDTPNGQLDTAIIPITGVSSAVIEDWGSGFTGNLSFTHSGTEEISSWQLQFDSSFEPYESWDSTFVSHTTGTTTVNNAPFNAVLNPNDSVTVGFNANGASTGAISNVILTGTLVSPENYPPTEYEFNNVPVDGPVSGGDEQLSLRFFVGEEGNLTVIEQRGYPEQQ